MNDEGLRSSGRAIRAWPADWESRRRGRPRVSDERYVFMLYDDLKQVVPYQENYVRLVPSTGDDVLVRNIAYGLATEYRRGEDLQRAAAEFIRLCAQTVVLYGSATYEISYLSADDVVERFQIDRLPPYSTRRIAGLYSQHLPKGVANRLNRRQWLRLDSKQIVRAELPRRRRKEIARAVRGLGLLSRYEHGIDFESFMAPALSAQFPYDWDKHRYASDLAVARATRDLGWGARGTFDKRQSEPYQVYRAIKFALLRHELRKMAVDALNEALGRAGEVMGFHASLRLVGLPEANQLEDDLRHLVQGDRPLEDLLERSLFDRTAREHPPS